MKKRIKVLHIDLGGCEGCSVSILRAITRLDLPCEIHSRYLGGEYEELQACDLALVTGSVCLDSDHAVQVLKHVRAISREVVAFGSCASLGGITRFCRGGQQPKPSHRVFQPLSSVIKVDFAIPGCPPPPQAIISFLSAYAKGITRTLDLFRLLARVRKLSGYDLIDDVVLAGLCVGCGACELSCPVGAIRLIEGRPEIAIERCIRCGTCYVRCPRAVQILLRRFSRP